MSTSDNTFLYAAISAKLTGFLVPLPTRPSWFTPWQGLNPDSPEQKRLEVYQAIRDSDILPDDAGFYLVTWQIDAIAREYAESALRHLDERLAVIEAKHGLGEDEVWEPGEAPPEYEEVLRQYHAAWDAIFVDQLERRGESALAALIRPGGVRTAERGRSPVLPRPPTRGRTGRLRLAECAARSGRRGQKSRP